MRLMLYFNSKDTAEYVASSRRLPEEIGGVCTQATEYVVVKWLDELKVDRDDTSLHFLFHLTDSERLPEILPLINDVNCFVY